MDFQFFAFFVCFRFFFGLVCCAAHSFGFYSLGLVQRFDILPTNVLVIIGSEKGPNVDTAGLIKKNLKRCQISSSKTLLVRFPKKIFFLVKDWFIQFEGLRRSVTVLVGSERGLIVDLACLRKKNLIRCQISSSKILLMRFYFL